MREAQAYTKDVGRYGRQNLQVAELSMDGNICVVCFPNAKVVVGVAAFGGSPLGFG